MTIILRSGGTTAPTNPPTGLADRVSAVEAVNAAQDAAISVVAVVDHTNPPIMSYVSPTSLTITSGECVVRNGGDRRAWVSTTAITKTLSPWALGSGVGGRLPASAFGLGATVYVFALMNGSGVIEVGYDNNVNCTNKPTDFDWFKLIGAFQLLTSGSAHFRPFLMDKKGWVRCNSTEDWTSTQWAFTGSYVSYPVTGLPDIEVVCKIVINSGLPTGGGGFFSIKISGTGESLSLPSGGAAGASNCDVSAYHNGSDVRVQTATKLLTTTASVKAAKVGSAYHAAANYSSLQLTRYQLTA